MNVNFTLTKKKTKKDYFEIKLKIKIVKNKKKIRLSYSFFKKLINSACWEYAFLLQNYISASHVCKIKCTKNNVLIYISILHNKLFFNKTTIKKHNENYNVGSLKLSCDQKINHSTYEYDFVDTGLHA